MQLKENKTTTKLTKQDLQKIVGGTNFINSAYINSFYHNRDFLTSIANKIRGRR